MAGRKSRKTKYYDYAFLFIVLFLLGFGLIMIYSASAFEGFNKFHSQTYFLRKQAIAIGIGAFAMLFGAKFPYSFWKKLAPVFYVVAILVIFLVRTKFGIEANGAYRWVEIPGIGMNVQVAEVVKLCMIFFYATFIEKYTQALKTPKGLAFYLLSILPVFLLLWKITNNFSSAFIASMIPVVMLLIVIKFNWIMGLAGVIAAGVATAIVFYVKNADISTMSFRFARIKAWLDPESYAASYGMQTLQSLYAIGSGGVFGKGLGQSMQKIGSLPEAQNDMIFAIVCEELGLFGAISVIVLFTILIWRMVVIANNSSDFYGTMLVIGVMAHISLQVVLNIAVVTNTIPNTGISLPFISYGGSSVLFLMFEMGLVMNVAEHIEFKENQNE